jgi:S1-C subfamily serine protease
MWLIVGGLLMIGLWVVVIIKAGGIGSVLEMLLGPSAEMTIQIQSPGAVNVGDEISLVITIENLGEDYLEIDEFLFPNELLEAAEVTSIFPGTTTQDRGRSMTSFEIGYAIAPTIQMDFTITLQATAAISFTGEIEIKSGLRREEAEAFVAIIGPGGSTGPVDLTEFGRDVPFRSVVKITARYSDSGRMVEGWSGSGSIISADGLILTNAHVVLPDRFFPVDELIISLTEEPDRPPRPTYRAEVLQADRDLDIAVIRITTDLERRPVDYSQLDLPVVELGEADQLRLGDSLAILGYPGIGGDTITLTSGEVSGFTSDEEYGDRAFIKTSATIAGGNSGGLVADDRGRLIGIPTQLGSGADDLLVDCRVIADTNRDGVVDNQDSCIPTGGFINALRPIDLALPMIEAATLGEISIVDPTKPDIPVPVGNVILYSDDFASSNSGWDHGGGAEGFVGYSYGEYQVEVEAPYYLFWGRAHNQFVDTVITVQARIVTPVGDGDYGVICRFRDPDNFYALTITEDRYAAIWKMQDGEPEILMDWTFAREIPRYEPATISAACLANELTLAVDGVVLGQVSDFAFANGDIGLFGGVWANPGFTIAFDNIEVRSP